MAAPIPYLTLAGGARDALTFYQGVFSGDLEIHTFTDFGRSDGEADWVAHGELRGPVPMFAADADTAREVAGVEGVLFALLGAADPETSTAWFRALAVDGRIVDDLQARAWGDWDGQVRDRFGLTWLIGFHPEH